MCRIIPKKLLLRYLDTSASNIAGSMSLGSWHGFSYLPIRSGRKFAFAELVFSTAEEQKFITLILPGSCSTVPKE
jgi:hypothetical protein